MKLFHRTNADTATAILRDGFKDKPDPTRTNLGFYDQIPEIKADSEQVIHVSHPTIGYFEAVLVAVVLIQCYKFSVCVCWQTSMALHIFSRAGLSCDCETVSALM